MAQANTTEVEPETTAILVRQPRVIVLERKSKKKKRKHSSDAAKRLDRIHSGGADAVVRIYDGLLDGAKTYRKKSRKSAKKKRDGRVRDALLNWTAAFADAGSTISKAPNDFAKKAKIRRWHRVD